MRYTVKDPFGDTGFDGFPNSTYYTSCALTPEERRRRQQIADAKRIGEMKRERRYLKEKERRERMELQRRQEIEILERQRLAREEAMLRRQGACAESYCGSPKPHEGYASYPPGTIVRGPDGRWYKIVALPDYKRDNKAKRRLRADARGSSNESEDVSLIRKVEEASINGESADDSKHELSGDETDIPIETRDGKNIKSATPVIEKQISTEPSDLSEQSLPLHMISVEEVSDDEDEEIRDLHSVWRNRMPSPGEWMEPRETFDSHCT